MDTIVQVSNHRTTTLTCCRSVVVGIVMYRDGVHGLVTDIGRQNKV